MFPARPSNHTEGLQPPLPLDAACRTNKDTRNTVVHEQTFLCSGARPHCPRAITITIWMQQIVFGCKPALLALTKCWIGVQQ